MAFSVNTNIASLQAQSYLRANSDFQSKTINRVTSGLRIVSSGDDAAGLAIANGFRSDEAVLTQGIRNANDGLSTLQTIDGGINNISQLLDRARTLATQSASGTFTGDRSVLNNEFASVMTEINRQAQSIGLDQGGQFAKALSVFVGGGKTNNGTNAVVNGSVSVDLTQATVDTKSLGLQGFSAGYQKATAAAADSGFYDLSGNSNPTTSVQNILGAANGSPKGTSFTLTGTGFSDAIAVNLNGVTDTASLATAINAAIQASAATDPNLRKANITAVIHTGADGSQQLQFQSSSQAFSVTAGDGTANALLGNFGGGQTVAGDNNANTATGAAPTAGPAFVAQGTQQVAPSNYVALTGTQTITFTALDSNGAPQSVAVNLNAANGGSAAAAAAAINAALQKTNNALQGIFASTDSAGAQISFSSGSTSAFTVTFGGPSTAGQGFTTNVNTVKQSNVVGVSQTSDISTQSAAEAAVSALASAVSQLGQAQAVVGKGQNNFNYASSLAQSQLTNIAAAESRIRDADLATEAANLSKAQILVQAGAAALAQANAAPQAILSLLK